MNFIVQGYLFIQFISTRYTCVIVWIINVECPLPHSWVVALPQVDQAAADSATSDHQLFSGVTIFS